MEWRFYECRKGIKSNPDHLAFFHEEISQNGIVGNLVREDIQNRLDARINKNGLVTVRYTLSSVPLTKKTADKYFIGLKDHFNSPGTLEELQTESFAFSRDIPFLLIDCFETTGLRGNSTVYKEHEARQEDPRNDFYWFVRNVGRSGKGKGDRGRWGIGKVVYPASSVIRSFFCYSIRQDKQRLLIGRSVLGVHEVDTIDYDPDGFWGEFDDTDDKCFVTPVIKKSILDEFKLDFNILRKDDQPGTTTVIPFPDDTITEQHLIFEVINSYFWMIFKKQLVVVIGDVRLDSDTIREIPATTMGINQEDWDVLQGKINFCKAVECLNVEVAKQNEVYFNLKIPQAYGSGTDVESLFEKEDLEKAKKCFADCQILCFEVNVEIAAKNELQEKGSFFVFLKKEPTLRDSDITFIRDGLTIVGEKKIREYGVRALVLADQAPVNDFLGDAETPAHTKFDKKSKHLKKYTNHSVLTYIQEIANKLSILLGRTENQVFETLLDDFFSIPENELGNNENAIQRDKPKEPGGSSGSEGEGFGEKRYYDCYNIIENEKAGVKFKQKPGSETPVELIIRFAYASEASGNPFRKYHPADFNLANNSSFEISPENCECEFNFNKLAVKNIKSNYSFKVIGFDRNRDLINRITTVASNKVVDNISEVGAE
jgi:hypothetical protein